MLNMCYWPTKSSKYCKWDSTASDVRHGFSVSAAVLCINFSSIPKTSVRGSASASLKQKTQQLSGSRSEIIQSFSGGITGDLLSSDCVRTREACNHQSDITVANALYSLQEVNTFNEIDNIREEMRVLMFRWVQLVSFWWSHLHPFTFFFKFNKLCFWRIRLNITLKYLTFTSSGGIERWNGREQSGFITY